MDILFRVRTICILALFLVAVTIALLTPTASLAEKGDGYFEAPSSGNTLEYEIKNIGETTLEGLNIHHIVPVKESDPANLVLEGFANSRQRAKADVGVGDTIEFRLGPYKFAAITSKEQCDAFKQNPEIVVYFDSQHPLVDGNSLRVEIPIKPLGFSNPEYVSTACEFTILDKGCFCEVGSCEYLERKSSIRLPGCDSKPPDENLIVSTDIPDPSNEDPASSIGVLKTPVFGNYLMALLDFIGQTARMVDPIADLGETLADEVRVVIIPSSALSILEDSESFPRNLEEYINAGGNIIIFSQSSGAEWALLPGYIGAYGYGQDMSCFSKGAKLNLKHPVLSSENTGYSDVHMDGFFRDLPADSEELLTRESNSQAAMIVYQWGLGTVIATDMYPDYAYWTGQYSQDELNYTRDMITWALQPAELREFKPGDALVDYSFTVELPADAGADGAEAWVTVWDPDRKVVIPLESIDVSLIPGSTQTISIDIDALPDKLGIWHVSYEILDAGGMPIHYEEESLDGRFVVADWHLEAPGDPDINVYPTQENDQPILGSTHAFHITVENNKDTPVTLTLQRDINHTKYREILLTRTFEPGEVWGFTDPIPVVDWPSRYRYNLLYKEDWAGGDILSNWKSNWNWPRTSVWGEVLIPHVEVIALTSDQSAYYNRDDVNLEAILAKIGPVGGLAEVRLNVMQSGGGFEYTETRTIDLDSGTGFTEDFTFALDGAPAGHYSAVMEEYLDGEWREVYRLDPGFEVYEEDQIYFEDEDGGSYGEEPME